MTLNIKSISIDADRATLIAGPANPVTQKISFIRGNEYVLQANVYTNSSTNVCSSFTTYDTWGLYIGSQFESNASPVVIVTDVTKWNNTVSDWSQANVVSGQISCRVNVSGTALDTDLGNSASKSYHMEIVYTNNAAGMVVVNDCTCFINNAVQKI